MIAGPGILKSLGILINELVDELEPLILGKDDEPCFDENNMDFEIDGVLIEESPIDDRPREGEPMFERENEKDFEGEKDFDLEDDLKLILGEPLILNEDLNNEREADRSPKFDIVMVFGMRMACERFASPTLCE